MCGPRGQFGVTHKQLLEKCRMGQKRNSIVQLCALNILSFWRRASLLVFTLLFDTGQVVLRFLFLLLRHAGVTTVLVSVLFSVRSLNLFRDQLGWRVPLPRFSRRSNGGLTLSDEASSGMVK